MDFTITGLLDNDVQKHGTHLHGVEITPFQSINNIRYDHIVLATPFYADIVRQLTGLGIDSNCLIRLGASYSFDCSIFETHAAQQQLRNRNFTLISNDCWGGILYSWLGIQFQTPFINLVVPPQDYITLAGDIEYFLNQDLIFHAEDQKNTYPVGALDGVRIHFVHDPTSHEAKLKWNRRIKRINRQNIFFKFETEDLPLIKSFDNLAVPRKIVFTRNQSATSSSVILLQDHGVEGPQLHRTCSSCLRHIDLIKWLNTGIATPPEQ
ncbi:MAG: hypothetical protein A2520_06505 [Deltaproteobacteria bacterium RIFOXYD12_FULL_53_23]|nr:MAG: hypothetical protein A2520_06505 [Deltaproteobacteria bacterium RIFOXYD12_FULL_53_23]